tara:strand:- start:4055 stop:4651 length:597 start_codon:yes stop_codon:yes gene_type:complete
MIIHNYNLVIITPPKTGSVSIAEALKDHLSVDKWLDQSSDCFDFVEKGHQKLSKHNSIHDYMEYVDSYYIVGCVRNPFERMVSWWLWFKKPTPYRMDNISFCDFVSNKGNHIKFADINQVDFLSINGKCLADDWIRFESLNSDFNRICTKASLGTHILPHRNKTNHKHYTEYYDDTTREIVTKKYQKDIDYFGYEFGK